MDCYTSFTPYLFCTSLAIASSLSFITLGRNGKTSLLSPLLLLSPKLIRMSYGARLFTDGVIPNYLTQP